MFVKNKGIKNKKSIICYYSDTWALALKNLAREGLSVLSAAWESSFSNRFVIFYKYQQTSHENQTIKQLILLQWKPKDHLFQILAGSTQMFTIFLAIGYSFQWHLFIICCKQTTTTTATTLQPNTNSSNNNKSIFLTGYWAACSTFLTTVTGDSRASRWSGCSCIQTWDQTVNMVSGLRVPPER